MKSIQRIWVLLLLECYLSSAIIFTPENAICLSPGNLGTEKKFQGQYLTAYVEPVNLNASVNLGKKLCLHICIIDLHKFLKTFVIYKPRACFKVRYSVS